MQVLVMRTDLLKNLFINGIMCSLAIDWFTVQFTARMLHKQVLQQVKNAFAFISAFINNIRENKLLITKF